MLNNITAISTALHKHLPFSPNTTSPNSTQNDYMTSFYSNHVAAITGAGSGMGRELACHLAKMGCHLALSDIDAERLELTKELLVGYNIKVTTTVLDVSDKNAVDAWADDVMATHGKVNFIFNNAGVAWYSTVEGCSISELEWVMDVNFFGVVYGTKAFLPLIKNSVKQSGSNSENANHTKITKSRKYNKAAKYNENGHVINISSLFGLTAQPSQSAYNASKFAVRGFTESLRQELNIQRCGVSTTCIHPGGIKTNIANNARGNDSLSDLGMRTGSKAISNFNKFLKFNASDAAWIILRAAATNQPRCLIGTDAKILDAAQRIFPAHYSTVLHRATRLSRKLNPRRAKTRGDKSPSAL